MASAGHKSTGRINGLCSAYTVKKGEMIGIFITHGKLKMDKHIQS